jgi:hypothetical protein
LQAASDGRLEALAAGVRHSDLARLPLA